VNVDERSQHLLRGLAGTAGVLPHLDDLQRASTVFRIDFGLRQLPEEPGILLIRGARQYGKSTWLEGQIRNTIDAHGPGTAYCLDGEELGDREALVAAIRSVTPLFGKTAPVRRLFIDEITAVPAWERGLKYLVDAGELRDVLVVTTGSKATNLRRGAERLPGRKGKLERTSYLFASRRQEARHQVGVEWVVVADARQQRHGVLAQVEVQVAIQVHIAGRDPADQRRRRQYDLRRLDEKRTPVVQQHACPIPEVALDQVQIAVPVQVG
jgi:hypothetical protein